MSSENVLVPAALGIGGVAIAAPVAILWGVVKIVQKIMDERVEAAKRKIEAENTRIREWQSFQEKQAQKMNKLSNLNTRRITHDY